MPQPKSISPGKGREALRQKVQIFRLNMVRLNRTYYLFLKITSKIFKFFNYKQNFQNYLPQSNSSELRKFRAIRPHSPQIPRNLHILLTYSTLCFRHLLQQRTLRNSSELRKFRAVRPHSPRITRNSHHLLTLHLTFQMPGLWQRTP